MSEYIKKEELFEKMQESGSQFFDYSEVVELADSVPTYSFPEREKGTDFISRADTLKKMCGERCGCEFAECSYPCTVSQIINDMPSADMRGE